jgi:hemolysin III
MNTWSHQTSSSYTNGEQRVDAAIQGLAATLGVAAVIWLIATHWSAHTLAGLTIYGVSLAMTFVTSLAYGHISSGPSKELWRRIDHAIIFALIAGTYTPLAAYRLPEPWSVTVLAVMWSAALAGMVLKFVYPRRFEYVGMALCIIMGLTGVLFIHTLLLTLSPMTLRLLVVGVALYLIGTIALQLHRLRFHNAIWHLLVLAAAGVQFVAIATEFVA